MAKCPKHTLERDMLDWGIWQGQGLPSYEAPNCHPAPGWSYDPVTNTVGDATCPSGTTGTWPNCKCASGLLFDPVMNVCLDCKSSSLPTAMGISDAQSPTASLNTKLYANYMMMYGDTTIWGYPNLPNPNLKSPELTTTALWNNLCPPCYVSGRKTESSYCFKCPANSTWKPHPAAVKDPNPPHGELIPAYGGTCDCSPAPEGVWDGYIYDSPYAYDHPDGACILVYKDLWQVDEIPTVAWATHIGYELGTQWHFDTVARTPDAAIYPPSEAEKNSRNKNWIYDTSTNPPVFVHTTPDEQNAHVCPNQNGTWPNCNCPTGYHYFKQANQCSPNNKSVGPICPWGATGTYPNCSCPSGYDVFWVKYQGQIVYGTCLPKSETQPQPTQPTGNTCPSNSTGTYPNCTCTQPGYMYSSSQNICMPPNVCPSWANATITTPTGFTTCCGPNSPCSPGYVWHVDTKSCQKDTGLCPTGQIWSPTECTCKINQAATQAIAVWVKDQATDKPISGALVTVKYSNSTCITNSSGLCSVTVLQADSQWYVKASANGYATSGYTMIDITKNQSLTIKLTASTTPTTTCPSGSTGTYPNCVCGPGYEYQQTGNYCKAVSTSNRSILIINGCYDSSNKLPILSGSCTIKNNSTGQSANAGWAGTDTIDEPLTAGVSYTLTCNSSNYQTYTKTFTMTTSNMTLTIMMTPKVSGGLQCPSGSTGTYPNCTCIDHGYLYNYASNECLPYVTPEEHCPSDSTGTYPNCVCGSGYKYDQSQNSCIITQITTCPSNSTGTYPNCTCTASGYSYDQTTNTCKIVCPSNSTGTYPNCTCTQSGYTYDSSTNTCKRVTPQPVCPSNSTGTYPNCTCVTGYTYNSVSNTCVQNATPTTTPIQSKPWYDSPILWIGLVITGIFILWYMEG